MNYLWKNISGYQSCLIGVRDRPDEFLGDILQLRKYYLESGRRGSVQQAGEMSTDPMTGLAGSSRDSILPPPWRPGDAQPPQYDKTLRSNLLSRPTMRSEILVEGSVTRKLSVIMSADTNIHLSRFLYGDTVYLQVHRPATLVQLIQSFRSTLYYHQNSEPGVCTAAEFYYVITDDRSIPFFQAHDILLQTTKSVLASDLLRKCQNTDFMINVWQALSRKNPYPWASRYI
jgi:hypothetical protein